MRSHQHQLVLLLQLHPSSPLFPVELHGGALPILTLLYLFRFRAQQSGFFIGQILVAVSEDRLRGTGSTRDISQQHMRRHKKSDTRDTGATTPEIRSKVAREPNQDGRNMRPHHLLQASEATHFCARLRSRSGSFTDAGTQKFISVTESTAVLSDAGAQVIAKIVISGFLPPV